MRPLVQPLADGAGGHAEFAASSGSHHSLFSRCVVGVGGQGLAPVGDRRSGAVQDLGDEAVADGPAPRAGRNPSVLSWPAMRSGSQPALASSVILSASCG